RFAWNWDWSKVRLAPIMTRQEAHFWLVAMTEAIRRDVQPAPLVQELRGQGKAFDGDLTLDEAGRRIRPSALAASDQVVVLLPHLFSPRDLISLAREAYGLNAHELAVINQWVLEGFRRSILPYLADAELRVM